ncbi:MAG TPA: 16S rRNA (guanine(527)-N(7))-methyltransferase RsmG [Pyrinomonadaceae bacterium]|jgi:16S rRNA (guanine527-N7)-methyltransferase|nr:16S rRNA (guanine(527)-N(7))-methyltransferase RsmG [Pyrinomonadaceae bacterium]
MSEILSLVDEFSHALERHAPGYEVQLSGPIIQRLSAYYEQVKRWNARLHLVAPCSPEEFATRHVLESMLALPFLTSHARVADVGSGAGLPVIPCLIARDDLDATLIEANAKKGVFLREALRTAGVAERTRVVTERFEKTPPPAADFITCRALERFTEMFPKILEWSTDASTLLFFAGPTLRQEIERAALDYHAVHIPASEQRFLFVIKKVQGPKSKVQN